MDDLEFIFIDDCCADDSMDAVEAWAEQDSRVRVIRNRENLGPGPSRNRGIEAARGDYLSFVDPDDYVSPDFYQLLYAAASADGGHDIAKGLRETHRLGKTEDLGLGKVLNKHIRLPLEEGPSPSCAFFFDWQTAIYRRSLMDSDVHHKANRATRNTTFLRAAALQTEDIVLEERSIYHRVVHEGLIADGKKQGCYLDELDTLAQEADILEELVGGRLARDYLKANAEIRLTELYKGIMTNPMPEGRIDEYAERLAELIDAKNHLLTPEDCPAASALVEWQTLLPCVDWLEGNEALEGALHWIDFLIEHPGTKNFYIDEGAKAIASTIQALIDEKSGDGIRGVYSQLIGRMDGLPAMRRMRLWLKTHQRLIAKRNLRFVSGKIASKMHR